MTGSRGHGSRRWTSLVLWLAAVAMMLSTAVYQRLTGPTHPLRGTCSLGGSATTYRLIRSEVTSRPATVRIPEVTPGMEATLHWRRYPTGEPFVAEPMRRVEGGLEAELPMQPAAGKLEYFLVVTSGEASQRLPESEPVVLRYKDPVPAGVLIPHIALMFFGVLIGLRAGLAAIFAPGAARWLSWTTLILLTLGGMVFGPVVQKFAFGAFWTGWPHGSDLTDNKALVMWLVWILACGFVGLRPGALDWRRRLAVVGATLVMSVVYLIPHSLRGSELDYGAVDAGADPVEAIGTAGS